MKTRIKIVKLVAFEMIFRFHGETMVCNGYIR